MLAEVQYQTEGVRFLKRFVEGKLTSPLLLVGSAGVGRKLSLLKAIQEASCKETRTSDCLCSSCYTISKGIHPDIYTLTATEKDIGIDEIRFVINESRSYPSVAKFRCFIIDGADRLTTPAANAFLKTLEEPPARSRFFLIAENYDRVLPTIRSRCGKIRYLPLPESFVLSMVERYEEEAVKALVYTRMGEGSVGNAISYWSAGRLALRDQVFGILRYALGKDLPAVFSSVDAIEQDLLLAMKFLEQILHDIFIVRVNPERVIHLDCLDDLKKMEKKFLPGVWIGLARKIKDLQIQCQEIPLYLAFHFKAILAESFV